MGQQYPYYRAIKSKEDNSVLYILAGQPVQKHYWFVLPKIPRYFDSFWKFRRISVCFDGKLVLGRYKVNELFIYLYRIFGIFISKLLDDMIVQILACWTIPHFVFLLNFSTPNDSRRSSLSLLLFNSVYNSYLLVYILERWSPILF